MDNEENSYYSDQSNDSDEPIDSGDIIYSDESVDSGEAIDPGESSDVSDSPGEIVSVAISYDLAEAVKLKAFLENEGFQVVATNHDDLEIYDLAAHIERGVNLNVFSEEGFDATMLLDDFRVEQILGGGIEVDNGWGTCPQCQSKNLAIDEDAADEVSLLTYFKSFFRLMRGLRCDDCGHEWVTEKNKS